MVLNKLMRRLHHLLWIALAVSHFLPNHEVIKPTREKAPLKYIYPATPVTSETILLYRSNGDIQILGADGSWHNPTSVTVQYVYLDK
jgi:hypothetical protein